MKADILIKNGRVVTHYGIFEADVAINGEKISGLFSSGSIQGAEQIIDAGGKLVFPGIIDAHVHFNEPGREDWEGFETGSKSAAAGGITTIIDMPLNSDPCTVNKKELQRKIERGEKYSIVDFGLWGGATPDNPDNLEDLHTGGVAAFKAFLSYSGIEEFDRILDGDLVEILLRLGKMGNILGLHAENDTITSFLSAKLQKEGRIDRWAFLESRPPMVEAEAVNRVLFLAKQLDSPGLLHFVHTTLPQCIYAINHARMSGLKVTVETCPHYLTLTEEDFIKIGPVAKCAPPVRSEKEVEALWTCVKNGLVDTIGSDHSPCPTAAKERGNENIWEAWGGISGIQSMLPILFSEGVIKRKLSLPRLIGMMTYNPAKLFGLYPQKGTLQPGSDADIVLFDPNKQWTLKKEDLFYKNTHSPFVGKTMTGSVEMTFVRGKVVYEKGEIKASKGFGTFLRRQKAEEI